MHVELRSHAFDPWQELCAYQQQLDLTGQYGATASFVGTMRDFNEGDPVTRLWLEHYPGMTEKALLQISEEAKERWPVLDGLIIHRVGDIEPGDSIVLIAVWTAHRGTAFDACRYLIEELKHRTPFWKKETLQQGERWVEQNTPG